MFTLLYYQISNCTENIQHYFYYICYDLTFFFFFKYRHYNYNDEYAQTNIFYMKSSFVYDLKKLTKKKISNTL